MSSPIYFIGGTLVLLLLASGGLNACQYKRNQALTEEKARIATRLETALASVQSQSEAITQLEHANAELSQACTVADDVRERAAQADEYRAIVERQSAELKKAGSADYANPDCRALLAMDLQRACPLIADGLRQRAARSGAGAHGGGDPPGR